MKRRATMPLGVDVGAARVRVALCERGDAGEATLVAVACRPSLDDPAGAIGDAMTELATRERRCVLALRAPDTIVRAAAFPPMGTRERERAARFEAVRTAPFPAHDAAIRVAPLDGNRYVVGAARRSALDDRVATAKRAGLRPVAVDDAAFALTRAFPNADAVIDIGEAATLLVVAGDPLPVTRSFAVGGQALTAAVIASLGVDEATAEQRKRSVGLAGAGEHARDGLIEQLAAAIVETRAAQRAELRSIALCGNGARLRGFAELLERALAIPVHLGELDAGEACALPADVVRAASPDWGLAYGLALWGRDA